MEKRHLLPKLGNMSCGSSMAHKQLIDSLTSHISLYHSPSPNTNPNPRSNILRWFSSLSLHQRLSHLTFFDPKFVQILIHMLRYIHTKGCGSFIILPDLPSHDLPTLCFKKSRGLISRVSDSNVSHRLVFDSTLFFGSGLGEKAIDCSCSVRSLDSVVMADEFLTDVDRFVETMDALSDGAFLRGEESDLGSDWVELDWLKAKGYYSLEAFIANRLEVSLRLAWLNTNNSSGKQRGIKLKLKEKLNAAALAANAYWRIKACADWWLNMDVQTHNTIWTCLFGKSAKSVINEILREANQATQGEMWLFNFGGGTTKEGHPETSAVSFCDMIMEPNSISRIPNTITSNLSRLYVLQEFASLLVLCQSGLVSVQSVFFSSLGSVTTLSDCILRKLRGFLMVISVDSVKLELLEENTQKCSPSSASKPRSGVTSRKHKQKTRNMKKPNPNAKSDKSGNLPTKSIKKDQAKLEINKNKDAVECKKVHTTSTMLSCSDASAVDTVKKLSRG